MIGAGLLAKKAVERGLQRQPWVKTSLAPGSKVVTDYLDKAGLTPYLDALGFNLVGYGCTTCIGNSGPLPEDVSAIVADKNLVVCSVLSGNRNFEGRIQSQVRANYLASPPLVVAYALAGRMTIDLTSEPLGNGSPRQAGVYLREIWPSGARFRQRCSRAVKSEMFKRQYANVFDGDERWRGLHVPTGDRFVWDEHSTYIRKPPFVEGISREPAPLTDITQRAGAGAAGRQRDHRSYFAGGIDSERQSRRKISDRAGCEPGDFNSYGARRGNHEVMMRGTFAQHPAAQSAGAGHRRRLDAAYQPGGELMTIYDASMKYQAAGVPLMVLAGKEYGSGSSRDWAAKGTLLLGVRVVIAESFERIHRSNLVNMGVLPLQFKAGETAASLKLTGTETLRHRGGGPEAARDRQVRVQPDGAPAIEIEAVVRIDTPEELTAFRHGGILPYVLRQLVDKTS